LKVLKHTDVGTNTVLKKSGLWISETKLRFLPVLWPDADQVPYCHFGSGSISIVTSSVIDPDWIRISNLDPDPGGQKCPRKIEKS
jgi:hypothetical protein